MKGCPDADGWTSIAKLSRRTGDGESGETAANATRLALCWNMHDELVSALRQIKAIAMNDDKVRQAAKHLGRVHQIARDVLAKLEGGGE